ncbi:MAG: hypothetical protein NC221_03710 [Duncaniella sp.]|nr:hypothetical protein [Muribaculum sp.]MCM1255207.1 hypothetical protein [Duncaniella sp.]
MDFDDKGNDYFLHKFNEETDGGDSTQVSSDSSGSQTVGITEDKPTSGEFTFPEAEKNNGKVEKRKHKRHGWLWFFFILFVALGVTVYIRYFVPYATESRTTGFVTKVEKRGIIFKTFEGEMISQSQLTDTAHVYSRDFYFSIPNDSLARVIQSYEGTGCPVTITCKRYFGTLPWRGTSKTIAVSIDN